MSKTSIAWTDFTFNPWWGCTRVSPGCERCYAETFSHRLGLDLWGPIAERRFFGDKHWNEPVKWDRGAAKAGRRARVFCASMADVFEDRPDLDPHRERLWSLIEATPNLDWQLLTKRPENMRKLAPGRWAKRWPNNVWAMVTAEDQQRADERIPLLMQIPARIRGVSYEPALGPVNFTTTWTAGWDWIIVGGESGSGARRFNVAWARSVVRQCRSVGLPVFVKQLGANVIDRNDAGFLGEGPAEWPDVIDQEDRVEDGIDGYREEYQGAPVRIRLADLMGGDPQEWPPDLRVREFPA